MGHNTFKMARDLFDAALWGYPGGGQEGRKRAQGLSCPLLISPFRCATMTAAQEKQEGTTMEKTKANIVACAGAGGNLPQNYPLLDGIVAKGCPYGLTWSVRIDRYHGVIYIADCLSSIQGVTEAEMLPPSQAVAIARQYLRRYLIWGGMHPTGKLQKLRLRCGKTQ